MTMLTMLESHDKDLGGGFMVRRVLPSAARQAVGPFVFFDHFGPVEIGPDADHDVRPHPHIGLATVTYLYEGETEHRDSVGSVQRITPGALNWMTSGRGIVHSERTPVELKGKARRSHGLQLWAALPLDDEETAPRFASTPASAIPMVRFDGGEARILIGSAFGKTSPVETFSETYYVDIKLDGGNDIVIDHLPEEAAIYPVLGRLEVNGHALAQHTMAYLGNAASVRVSAGIDARFVVIGGAPLDGHRHMFWNFVSSRRDRIAIACKDWEQQRFDPIDGETEWTPLPRPFV